MSEAKIGFVEPLTFSVDLPLASAPVAVGAEGNEIVVLVRLTLRPVDNVVNVNIDMSAGGDGASVTGLHKYASAEVCGYCWAFGHSYLQYEERQPSGDSA